MPSLGGSVSSISAGSGGPSSATSGSAFPFRNSKSASESHPERAQLILDQISGLREGVESYPLRVLEFRVGISEGAINDKWGCEGGGGGIRVSEFDED